MRSGAVPSSHNGVRSAAAGRRRGAGANKVRDLAPVGGVRSRAGASFSRRTGTVLVLYGRLRFIKEQTIRCVRYERADLLQQTMVAWTTRPHPHVRDTRRAIGASSSNFLLGGK